MTFIKRKGIPKLNDDLRGLISLSNNNFDNIDDALTNYIQFGIDKIGFEFGAVNKVIGQDCQTLKIISTNKWLTKEKAAAFCGTTCKNVVKTKSTLTVVNKNNSILYDFSIEKKFEITTIICTPLIVDQKLFGTLTFLTSGTMEKDHLWDYCVNMVEILGHSVCKILKEQIDKNNLTTKSKQLEQFNQDLKDFVKIGEKKYANFSNNLMAYIDFGRKITGFENAFISEINNEVYTIIEGSINSCKSKPGDIFKLCDTLCREAVEKQTTVAYPKLKGSKYYDILGRVAFKSESSIIVPLRINNKIIGVVRFCSTQELDDDYKFKFYVSIVELIAEKIAKLVQQNRLSKELNKEKLLLKMGAEVFEMASYSRVIRDNIVYVTPAFGHIFELVNKNVESLHINELINILDQKVIEEDKPDFYKNIEKTKTQNIEPFEYRIRTSCGKIKWLRHQIRFDEGHSYVLGVVQNITPIKQAQEKLQIKNAELEQFAYATAHDLQEPLRTINGFCKILTKTCEDKLSESDKEYFSYMIQASNRMREQIEGLLRHSRIGQKRQMELVNMNNLLINVLSDLKGRIDSSKATIIIRDLPDVFGYGTELRLLLLNLIGNALKFIQPGISPTIEVGYCEAKAHYHTFYVKDNGIGISEENIQKIFNLFARLNRRSEFGGTGIGLAHCKKIAHLHNGEICVRSKLGKGSTFSFAIKK